jgi:hypothetical protein
VDLKVATWCSVNFGGISGGKQSWARRSKTALGRQRQEILVGDLAIITRQVVVWVKLWKRKTEIKQRGLRVGGGYVEVLLRLRLAAGKIKAGLRLLGREGLRACEIFIFQRRTVKRTELVCSMTLSGADADQVILPVKFNEFEVIDISSGAFENEFDTHFGLLAPEQTVLIRAYTNDSDDKVLSEIQPRFIIMFEPNMEFIRRIEVSDFEYS